MKTKEILEKIKSILMKYNILFVIPVVLISILSICFIKDPHVKLYLFILTWVLITFQFIGVKLSHNKMKQDNLEVIEKYKETIETINKSTLYTDQEKLWMIDSCYQIIDILTPKKRKFKTKITRLFK